MSEHTRTLFTGISCDARDCTARIAGPELPHFEGRESYTCRAVASGWTVWVGRSTRHYCPDHGPARGHSMREITSAYAEQG